MKENKKFVEDTHLTIDLALEPILVNIHRADRICDNIISVGDNCKYAFEQDEKDIGNHNIEHWLPLGLTFVTNGNHTVYSAMLKKKGILNYPVKDAEFPLNEVYDISGLYDFVRFDGENYIFKIDGKEYVVTAPSFEFGCIFEIGRLMLEQKK